MLFYSVPLIVLVSLPLYFGLSLAVVPILRARLDTKFARGAENQAMLVQRLYSPEGGRLLVNGIDISLIDAARLRRQVGIVHWFLILRFQ